MKQILILDDDIEHTYRLAQFLRSDGFEPVIEQDADAGIKKALHIPFDFLILNNQLGNKNGFDVLKNIRIHSQIPIILVNIRGGDIDKIIGLEMGADDCMSKPFNPRELIARIRAILRRSQIIPPARPILQYHDMMMDTSKRELYCANKQLELTNTEFNILEILMRTPAQAFSKEELTKYALGKKYTIYDRSIDVHISNLRNKLGHNPRGEPWLTTVRGFGYRFNI